MPEKNKNEKEKTFQHPPHIMQVYFSEDPIFDFEEMQAFLLDADPHGPQDISIESHENGFVVNFDKMPIQVIKAPETDEELAAFIQRTENYPEEFRTQLANHKVFYQANVLDFSAYGPFEAQIALIKLGAALCDADGICAAFPFTGTILPAKMLEDANETEFANEENHCDHEEGGSCCGADNCVENEEVFSIWDLMRQSGQPQFFFINCNGFPDKEGNLWMVSRGGTFCGVPDILVRVEKSEDFQKAAEFIQAVFSYQITNRKGLAPGTELPYDDKSVFKFTLPPQVEVPFPVFGCLLAEKNTKD